MFDYTKHLEHTQHTPKIPNNEFHNGIAEEQYKKGWGTDIFFFSFQFTLGVHILMSPRLM